MPLHTIYPKLTSVDSLKELVEIPEDCEALILTLASSQHPRVLFATQDMFDILLEKVKHLLTVRERLVNPSERSKIMKEHFSESSKYSYWLLSEYELYSSRVYLHYFKDGELIPVKPKEVHL